MWLFFILIAFLSPDFLRLSIVNAKSTTTQRIETKNVNFSSYLFNNERPKNKNPGIRVISEVLQLIHARQQPHKSLCSKTRLLVLNMAASLEGTGSILRDLMIGLAVAIHSNRTLIWGLDMPLMAEFTRDQWYKEDNSSTAVGNTTLDCRSHDRLAGPFSCFFEPLSTCTVDDMSMTELEEFTNNGYNDTARVMLVEVRKGVAVYHAPQNMFEKILAGVGKELGTKKHIAEIMARKEYIFAAATAAYAFRLKPDVVKIFEEKKAAHFPTHHPVFGLHVRHGDIKSESQTYQYKTIFEFDDFFAAARDLSHHRREAPRSLFVATDSVQADNIQSIFSNFQKGGRADLGVRNPLSTIETLQVTVSSNGEVTDEDDDEMIETFKSAKLKKRGHSRKGAAGHKKNSSVPLDRPAQKKKAVKRFEYSGKHSNWFSDQVPNIAVLNSTLRYRTPHGSHTVAADGGCVTNAELYKKGLGICAITKESMDLYRNLEYHKTTTRSMRLMRVLLESIEDLYLLSQCDALVAQGSSYFSTFAGMLIFARTGVADMLHTALFLDNELTASGTIPTAYLPYTHDVNPTNNLVNDGSLRWIDNVNIFVSGLENSLVKSTVTLDFDPWSADMRMKMVNGLPKLPDVVFYTESSTWLGTSVRPVWPGHCPRKMRRGDDIVTFVNTCVNLGVEHYEISHPVQAMHCWQNALRIMQMAEMLKGMTNKFNEAREIASENMRSLKLPKYDRYLQYKQQLLGSALMGGVNP